MVPRAREHTRRGRPRKTHTSLHPVPFLSRDSAGPQRTWAPHLSPVSWHVALRGRSTRRGTRRRGDSGLFDPPPPLASIALLPVCLSGRTGAPTYPSFVPLSMLMEQPGHSRGLFVGSTRRKKRIGGGEGGQGGTVREGSKRCSHQMSRCTTWCHFRQDLRGGARRGGDGGGGKVSCPFSSPFGFESCTKVFSRGRGGKAREGHLRMQSAERGCRNGFLGVRVGGQNRLVRKWLLWVQCKCD